MINFKTASVFNVATVLAQRPKGESVCEVMFTVTSIHAGRKYNATA